MAPWRPSHNLGKLYSQCGTRHTCNLCPPPTFVARPPRKAGPAVAPVQDLPGRPAQLRAWQLPRGGGGKGLGNRANGKIERGEKLVAYLVEASQFRGSATVRGTVGQHRDKAGGGGGAVRDRVVEARAGYRVAAGGLEGDGLAAVEQRWDFPPPGEKPPAVEKTCPRAKEYKLKAEGKPAQELLPQRDIPTLQFIKALFC